jgi:hypothetical protein
LGGELGLHEIELDYVRCGDGRIAGRAEVLGAGIARHFAALGWRLRGFIGRVRHLLRVYDG